MNNSCLIQKTTYSKNVAGYASGNLISDSAENIKNIRWNVYGKIAAIEKKNGDEITYSYDAAGNRISENFNNEYTFYLRDASGNMVSTYTANDTTNNGNLTQSDVELYGSSRLGIDQLNLDVQDLKQATAESRAKKYGSKRFELTEHRGNVMAVIGENKTPIDDNNDGLVDGYTPQILQANDYSSYGATLPGRTFAGTGYRYGYNGKENDKDISSGAQDYGMRINDTRLGRFLSVDPITSKFSMLTPYQFASNRPIDGIDLDGLEYLAFHTSMYKAKETLINAPLSQTVVETVYENIPAQLQNPQTCDVKFVAGGIVTAFGRDYDSKIDGPVIYDADKYYRKDAPFNGTASGTSTSGIDALKGNAIPGGGTGTINAGNINSMGSILGSNGVGLLQNAWNYLLPWSEQAAIDKEKALRQGFYDATNALQQNIDMSRGIIYTKSGTAPFDMNLRNATHNFMTDGTLEYTNTKESMIGALNAAHYGVQILAQQGIKVQEKTKQAITDLLNNYKAAGGGNEYDNISQFYEKKDD